MLEILSYQDILKKKQINNFIFRVSTDVYVYVYSHHIFSCNILLTTI